MVIEQTTNDIIQHLQERLNVPLPDIGVDTEPVASNLEELVGILGATEVDPLTLEPLEDEPETPDPLEMQPEAETPDPLAAEPEQIKIEQKKDE